MLDDKLCRTVQLIFGHAELLQRSRGADTRCEIIKTLGGILDAKGFGNSADRFRCGVMVECDGVRKNDRVHVCVRKTECATQDMTDVVMNRHAHGAEHHARQPRAV